MKNLGEALERVTRVAGIRGAMLVAESDGLVVFGSETSVGLVQLFFQELETELAKAAPTEPPTRAVLAENFEHELNASLRSLFGR